MKQTLIWILVMFTIVAVYLIGTDLIGSAFGDEDGTYTRRLVGYLAVSWLTAKLTDRIVEKLG